MTAKIIETVGLIVMMFVILGVHELGHLITGLRLGFRFELFVVGPLGIKRENNRIKVYLNKNIAHYGGLAATIPTSDNPENGKILARICIAGPIASIAFAVILGVLYIAVPSSFLFSKTLLIGAVTSTAIFLVTTIPSKTGMFFTDRKRYQRLTSDGPEKEVELALLRIIGNYGKDDSYINVDLDDIETVILDEHYKFFGLFTKLTYQFEVNGHFDLETKKEYDKLAKTMSKSMVKATDVRLNKLGK